MSITKQDLQEVLNEKFGEFKNEIRGEFQDFKVEIKSEMREFKGEMKQEFQAVRGEIAEVIEVVNEFANHVEERFQSLEGRMENIEGRMENIEGRMENIEGCMENIEGRTENVENGISGLVTQEYFDEQMAELRGDFVIHGVRKDRKVTTVVDLLVEKKVFTPHDRKRVLGMESFE